MNIHHLRSTYYTTDTDRIYARMDRNRFRDKTRDREISLREGEFLDGRLTINSSPDRRLDFKWPEMGRILDFSRIGIRTYSRDRG